MYTLSVCQIPSAANVEVEVLCQLYQLSQEQLPPLCPTESSPLKLSPFPKFVWFYCLMIWY